MILNCIFYLVIQLHILTIYLLYKLLLLFNSISNNHPDFFWKKKNIFIILNIAVYKMYNINDINIGYIILDTCIFYLKL